MKISKRFSKAQVESVLSAAGLNFAEVQKQALLALSSVVRANEKTISDSKEAIARAEIAIKDASSQLKTAKETLKIVDGLSS